MKFLKTFVQRNLCLILFLICGFNSFSQDVITMRNGDEIKSKVLEVTTTEIKYKKFDFLDGPTYTTLKSDIFMIVYQNGTKEVMPEKAEKLIEKPNIQIQSGEIARQARKDADENYPRTEPFLAGFSSVLLSPLFALIPSAIVSSHEPDESKLKYPNQELYDNNIQYQNEYQKEAYKIKKRTVWGGYGVGVFINVMVTLTIIFKQ